MSTDTGIAMTLPGFVADLGRRFGEKPALVGDRRTVSFADLDRGSERIAGGLQRIGVARGDRVAVWLPNIPEWMEVFLGCARLGAIVLALNTRFRSREVGDILERSGAKVLVFWPGYEGAPFTEVLAQIGEARLASLQASVLYDPEAKFRPLPPPLDRKLAVAYASLAEQGGAGTPPPSPDDGCLIYTTSGTTSLPKFALHSHRSLVRHARDLAAAPWSYATADSVGLTLMPLCGAFGMTQTLGALAGGATTHLPTAFVPLQAAQIIGEHRVTNMAGVDDVFYRLLEQVPGTPAFPSLRYVAFGSFNGSAEDFIRVADARGLRGVGAYGMSEIQGLFALQPADADADRRATGGGVPVSGLAQIRVRDPETGELLPHGVPGELEFKVPSMMLGYFGDEKATRATLTDDGFIRSGDLGTTTGSGMTFISRMHDVLRLSGFLVSPAEIAQYIEENPSVTECQVVGAHASSGFRPVAFVVLRHGAELDEPALTQHCLRGLAKFKVPVRFVALPEMPATDGPNGRKVQRHLLRAMAQEMLSRTSESPSP
jgi:fatty-acyl-CoA synthase